jgi:hypothetical protein
MSRLQTVPFAPLAEADTHANVHAGLHAGLHVDMHADMQVNGGRPDPKVLAALTGTDAAGELAVSLRTRRAVFNAVMSRRTDRAEGRRNLFLALLVTGGLVFALAPTVWSGMEDLLGGDTLTDLPGMVAALCMTLFAAVVAVLFLMRSDIAARNEQQTIAMARPRRRS